MLKPDFSRTISNNDVQSIGMYYTDSPGETHYLYELPQGESFVRSDVVHPNFKKRMKSGELIIGPYTASYEKITIGMGGGYTVQIQSPPSTTSRTNTSRTEGVGRGYDEDISLLTEADFSSKMELAKLEAISNIADSKFHFMEDVLSMRENVMFLRKPLDQLNSILTKKRVHDLLLPVKGLKRKDKNYLWWKNWMESRKPGDELRAMNNLYLSEEFGLAPILKSIQDAVAAGHVSLPKLEKNVRLRAAGVKTQRMFDSYESRIGLYDPFACAKNADLVERAEVFYKLKHTVDANSLSNKLGLRLKDLPVGLWNIIPLSFMVDRLLDVNLYLKAVMAFSDPNVVIEGGTISTLLRTTTSYQALPGTWVDGSNNVYTFNGGSLSTYHRTHKTRSAWAPSIPGLSSAFNATGLISSSNRTLQLTSLVLSKLLNIKR